MATEKKQTQENAFMHWYHSYQGKKVVNIVYSVGASVVIVGALFKILHWPGASYVLMAGMFTEAFLFIIGALEAPHEEYHWANVFPQLLEFGSPEERIEKAAHQPAPTLLSPAEAAKGDEAHAKEGTKVAALNEKEIEALNKSIKDLASTADQLAGIGKVAESTNKLSAKAEAAAEAADKFAVAASALGQKNDQLGAAYDGVIAGVQGAAENTKAFGKSVEGVTAKVVSLGPVYDLQLAAIQANNDALKANNDAIKANNDAIKAQGSAINANNDAFKAQGAEVAAQTKQIKAVGEQFAAVGAQVAELGKGVEAMQKANAEALKSQAAYEEATKKLAAQVADLNKIYGNMLNALA